MIDRDPGQDADHRPRRKNPESLARIDHPCHLLDRSVTGRPHRAVQISDQYLRTAEPRQIFGHGPHLLVTRLDVPLRHRRRQMRRHQIDPLPVQIEHRVDRRPVVTSDLYILDQRQRNPAQQHYSLGRFDRQIHPVRIVGLQRSQRFHPGLSDLLPDDYVRILSPDQIDHRLVIRISQPNIDVQKPDCFGFRGCDLSGNVPWQQRLYPDQHCNPRRDDRRPAHLHYYERDREDHSKPELLQPEVRKVLEQPEHRAEIPANHHRHVIHKQRHRQLFEHRPEADRPRNLDCHFPPIPEILRPTIA
ncbi:MAG: hypothetical protein IPM55_11860 [Acidobacteria bacterium]|nr:hypothetical protein [Acidobacteriota bacterium]